MARPRKLNADYFPHDSNERNKTTVKALRRKFSHMGYAVWGFLQEALANSEHFHIEWDELSVELLAADFDVTADDLTAIVEYAIKIGLLEQEDGVIYSPELQKNLMPLVVKRCRDRKTNIESNVKVSDSDNEVGIEREYGDNMAIIDYNGVPEVGMVDLNEFGDGFRGENAYSARALRRVKYSRVKESKVSAHTVILEKRKGGVGGKQAAMHFITWLKSNFPAFTRMAESFTEASVEAILEKYTDADINRIIEAIDNKGATKNKSAIATFNAFAANDRLIKERTEIRPYTYTEICDLVHAGGCKQADFEQREIEGMKCWVRKIDLIRAQA